MKNSDAPTFHPPAPAPAPAPARAGIASHPLELIPPFARWPASPLRNAAYTVLFSSLIALVLTAIQTWLGSGGRPLASYFIAMLMVANLCGLLIHGATAGLNRLLGGWPRRSRGLPRAAFHTAVSVACVLSGITMANALISGGPALRVLAQPGVVLQCVAIAALIAGITLVVHRNAERRVQLALAAARQQEHEAATARLLAEARLGALQAQIEPHFLYNTLANVVSLIGTQPDTARHMLERFIDYLRASLATSRAQTTTLGEEAHLLGAYLDVLAVRMGERLRWRIDVPAALREVTIAPMLLQPLVENAIAHGLEPKMSGGEVTLSAAMVGAQLQVLVSDTGVGIDFDAGGPVSTKPGGGVGLGNLRERLRTLYGSEARVELLENQPCGLTVRLLLPLPISPSAPATA